MCNSSKFAVIAVHSQNGNACLHTHYHHLEEPKVFAYSTPQSGSQEFRFDFKVILRSCATPTAAQVLCTFWKCYHNILQWEICFAYRTTEYYLSFYEQTLCISWNPFQKFLLYVHVMIWHFMALWLQLQSMQSESMSSTDAQRSQNVFLWYSIQNMLFSKLIFM